MATQLGAAMYVEFADEYDAVPPNHAHITAQNAHINLLKFLMIYRIFGIPLCAILVVICVLIVAQKIAKN